MKNDVPYVMAVAQANWNGINTLLGISGSSQDLEPFEFSTISGSLSGHDYYHVPMNNNTINTVKELDCKHCGQRHRIDYEKLEAISVLDCKKCGASLI